MSRNSDDGPEEPGKPEIGEGKPADAPINELEARLLKGRKVMIFGQITEKLARDVVARTLALADESSKAIQIYVMSSRVTRSTTSSSSSVRTCRST
jgi:ATP-dependent Clp protease protease subunit